MAVSVKLFMLPQVISPMPFSAVAPFCNSRYTTPGTAMANGTAMPAASSSRNRPNDPISANATLIAQRHTARQRRKFNVADRSSDKITASVPIGITACGIHNGVASSVGATSPECHDCST